MSRGLIIAWFACSIVALFADPRWNGVDLLVVLSGIAIIITIQLKGIKE